MSRVNEDFVKCEKSYKEFKNRFPLEKLNALDLDEYVPGKNDSFCSMVAYQLEGLGGIGNQFPRNFGVSFIMERGEYNFLKKYGQNLDEAFEKVKEIIHNIAQCAENKEYNKIDEIDFAEAIKWKIAFLYAPGNLEEKEILPIYSKDKLVEIAKERSVSGVSKKTPTSTIYEYLMKQKPSDCKLSDYYEDLWSLVGNNNNEETNSNNRNMSNNTTVPEYEKMIQEMLLANHNIILHGAPGTGKTYLAQKIAEELGATKENGRFKMVQFHPSYDYTDFVEGLRPTDTDNNGNIIFARQDGVFKAFCKDATTAKLYENTYCTFIKYIKDNNPSFVWGNRESSVSISDKLKIIYIGPKGQDDKRSYNYKYLGFLFSHFFRHPESDIESISDNDLRDLMKDNRLNTIDGTPYKWAIKKLLEIAKNKTNQQSNIEIDKELQINYIFLIDEINRGDMSKIFGELFFAIDPGYRGEKGKIDTQYQNLVEENDEFKKGFYVPNNVYIIGTMNDIDRSVDSMDFAMRRRFQFIEITAESRAEDMFKDDNGNSLSDAKTAKEIMTNLNNCIISKEIGLSKSYQIGGSYFKKFAANEEDAQSLWDYRLKGLLREYLRGDEEEAINNKLEILYKAYKKENEYSKEGKLVTKANQSQPTEPELNAQ